MVPAEHGAAASKSTISSGAYHEDMLRSYQLNHLLLNELHSVYTILHTVEQLHVPGRSPLAKPIIQRS